MQIGEVKGKGKKVKSVKGRGEGRDDATKLAEKNRDKQCFCCQKTSHIKSNCRNRQRDVKKAKESGEPVVDRKPAAAITDDQDDDITGAVIEGRQHGKQQS